MAILDPPFSILDLAQTRLASEIFLSSLYVKFLSNLSGARCSRL
jgi:hypothetical protein